MASPVPKHLRTVEEAKAVQEQLAIIRQHWVLSMERARGEWALETLLQATDTIIKLHAEIRQLQEDIDDLVSQISKQTDKQIKLTAALKAAKKNNNG